MPESSVTTSEDFAPSFITARSARSPRKRTRRSGSRLLKVAAQGRDLSTQLGRAVLVSTGKGHRQGEFQLFQLVITLGVARDLLAAAGGGERTPGRRPSRMGNRMVER